MNAGRYELGDRERAASDHVLECVQAALTALEAAQRTTTKEPGPSRPWARKLGQLVRRARDVRRSVEHYREGVK